MPGLRAPATLRAGLSVDAAIRLAKKDVGETQVAPARGDTGKPVLFHTAGGTRRAIQTVTMSAATPSLDVIDAETGRVLYRDLLSADLATQPAPRPRPARTGPTCSSTTREPRAVAAGRARSA